MANGHGGYRQPTNPSPVSGPGALSQRTDGPLHAPVPGAMAPGGASAPMAPGPDPSSLTPFGAPSERPDESIMAGMSGGPGPGPSLPPSGGLTPDQQERLRSYLPVFLILASSDDADPALKQYVRQLRGELG